MNTYSLYLHIPFCRHRCGYCDFNTYAGLESLIEPYISALCSEIELISTSAGDRLPVYTIFFGGGTPSLLPATMLNKILKVVRQSFHLASDLEITLEANPGTLSFSYLKELRQMGINRLSLGLQSANPGELRLLERQHTYADVIRSVTWARQAGFTNLNLDLIYGLPEQTLETWQQSLRLALGLHPEHLSLYALTLEHGTPLGHWAERGLILQPDPDLAADMYEWASAELGLARYAQYEISNWARQKAGGGSYRCRHNMQYWHNQPYLGLGAGAHGYAAGVRTANVLAPGAYIQRCLAGVSHPFPSTPATQSLQVVDRPAEIGETMMMGLRLTDEGVSSRDFQARFGQTLQDVFGEQIERLERLKLLEWMGEEKDRLRLTERGHLLGNQVFLEFIPFT